MNTKNISDMIDEIKNEKETNELFLGVLDSMKSVSDSMEQNTDDKMLKYHIPQLNDSLRGILPYSLVVVGAGTGLGKSQFITDLVYSTAKNGKKVVYFDLENDNGDFVRRIVSKKLSVLTGKYFGVDEFYTNDILRTPHGDTVVNLFSELEEEIGDNLRIYNNEKIPTFDEFLKYIEKLKDDEDVDLICIDHLHYFSMFESVEAQPIQIGKIMRGLRDLSKRDVPIVLASHIRPPQSGRPENHHLFGSSNISKEASVVILFHKEDDTTYMRVTKKRHGGQYYEFSGKYDPIKRAIDFQVGFDNSRI